MKYIIELEDEPMGKFEEDENYYRCKQIPYWSLSEAMINKLTPYPEHDRKAIEDEVWEFVRICLMMDGSDFVEVFDSYSYINLLEYSYQEAKAKYNEWKKQRDEIHVGDEVRNKDHNVGWTAVVVQIVGDIIYLMGNSGAVSDYHSIYFEKTGRHFDEVEELLEKMKEVKDGSQRRN